MNVLKASFYRQELAHGKYSDWTAVTKWTLYVAFVYGMACIGMYACGEHQTKHGMGPNPMPKSFQNTFTISEYASVSTIYFSSPISCHFVDIQS